MSNYQGNKISNLNINRASTPVVWMTAAESFFLRAEGALRGWDMGGTAKSFYEQGVRMSFEENNAAGVDDYLADHTSTRVLLQTMWVVIIILSAAGLLLHGMIMPDLKLSWNASLHRSGLPIIPTVPKAGVNIVVQAIRKLFL